MRRQSQESLEILDLLLYSQERCHLLFPIHIQVREQREQRQGQCIRGADKVATLAGGLHCFSRHELGDICEIRERGRVVFHASRVYSSKSSPKEKTASMKYGRFYPILT
jgi:hypothetical protein